MATKTPDVNKKIQINGIKLHVLQTSIFVFVSIYFRQIYYIGIVV